MAQKISSFLESVIQHDEVLVFIWPAIHQGCPAQHDQHRCFFDAQCTGSWPAILPLYPLRRRRGDMLAVIKPDLWVQLESWNITYHIPTHLFSRKVYPEGGRWRQIDQSRFDFVKLYWICGIPSNHPDESVFEKKPRWFSLNSQSETSPTLDG